MIETRYATRTGTWRTPAGREAVFAYRLETNDLNTINACLADNEYNLPRGIEGLAIDVGAHIGGVTVALALDNPELRVIAVEPVPDNLRLLRENVAQNGLENRVTVMDGAVGGPRAAVATIRYGYTGSEEATHHAFIGNISLLRDSRYVTGFDERTVRAYALSDLTDLPVAFLKIDVEGAEYAILRDPAVRRCAVVAGEWHNTDGHTGRDIAALFKGTHDVTFSGPVAGPGGFRAVLR